MHSCTMSIACPSIDCLCLGWGLIQYGTCRHVDTSPYEHNDTHSWKHYLPVENITFLWLCLQTVINLRITRRHTTVFVLNHVTPMGWFLKCISLKRYKVLKWNNIPSSLTSAWQNSLHFIHVTNVYGFILNIFKSLESQSCLFSWISVKYFLYYFSHHCQKVTDFLNGICQTEMVEKI